jgi:HD-GYP domain-containing protein (c-di-GMP phosphodiesterase class II)
MTDILEMRDTYTAFHSDRVALYAHAILLCMPSISARDAATIQRAARIHDIGKVAVRDAVLLKPGPLDQDERRAIESHSSIGADLIARMHAYRDCIDIIRHHHERWDGGGYPSRLVGDRIPIGARVIAVADSFDAMTTDRPYRQALSFEAAVEEVRKNAGIQFDPDVASAFLVAIEDPEFQRPPNPMSGQVAAD